MIFFFKTSVKTKNTGKEEADKLFNGLSEGSKVEMPIACGPWGNYFGMSADKFGVQRMADFDPKYDGKV